MGGRRGIVLAVERATKKTNNKKYIMTLDGRRSMTMHTTINQKHVGATEWVYERRCNQGGARRGG
jgi:hypothetical protein